MNKPHACDTVREMVFNYRRGELSELDEALFEESLDECPECARYVERILDMLTVSAEADRRRLPRRADHPGLRRRPVRLDRRWRLRGDERPTTRRAPGREPVEVPSTSGAPPVRLEFGLASPEPDPLEDEELAPVAPRWPRAVAAAPRCCWWPRRPGSAAARCSSAPGPTPSPSSRPRTSPDEGSPEDEDAALERAFADLERSPDRVEAVEVFASGGARWHLESRPPEHTLHLERGTVLVEFVPRGQETLRVISGGTEVDVVGTVFYVSTSERATRAGERAQPARVGVITGEVKVRQRSAPEAPAQEVTLREGQELAPDRDVQPIEESTRERSRELSTSGLTTPRSRATRAIAPRPPATPRGRRRHPGAHARARGRAGPGRGARGRQARRLGAPRLGRAREGPPGPAQPARPARHPRPRLRRRGRHIERCSSSCPPGTSSAPPGAWSWRACTRAT